MDVEVIGTAQMTVHCTWSSLNELLLRHPNEERERECMHTVEMFSIMHIKYGFSISEIDF